MGAYGGVALQKQIQNSETVHSEIGTGGLAVLRSWHLLRCASKALAFHAIRLQSNPIAFRNALAMIVCPTGSG